MGSRPRLAIVRRTQRVRDPVHNLIEFGSYPFEAQTRVKANVPNLDWAHRSAEAISPLTFPPG
jgi:hypothetical protein